MKITAPIRSNRQGPNFGQSHPTLIASKVAIGGGIMRKDSGRTYGVIVLTTLPGADVSVPLVDRTR